MVETSQHPAGVGCQAKLKIRSFYAWLIICRFTGDIFCTDAANDNQIKENITSITSSNADVSGVETYSDESSLDAYTGQTSDFTDLNQFSRAVPRVKTPGESYSEKEPKIDSEPDYILKIPVSLLRQYELYRMARTILRLQEHERKENEKKQNSVIPVPRFGRSNKEIGNNIGDIDYTFDYPTSEQDRSNEESVKNKVIDSTLPLVRNSRSILLLSSPKSEETSKQPPTQTFVLPYPRPGRSNEHRESTEIKNEEFIIPYPRPGRSKEQNNVSKMSFINSRNLKYILPTARLGRDPVLWEKKDNVIFEDWLSSTKLKPISLKSENENLSEKNMDETETSSLFVIPYPRPGKKSILKLKNRNQETKNSENEIADYMVPYPRPGKKSGIRKPAKVSSTKSKETEKLDFQNLILPYPRPGRSDRNFFYISDLRKFHDVINSNQNEDTDDMIEYKSNEMISPIEVQDLFMMPNNKFENKLMLPYFRTGRNFDNIVSYSRPDRVNEASHLFLRDMYIDTNELLQYLINFKKLEDGTSNHLRFKRSNSVVPYPRLGRSNVVVPYPRLGRSDSVVSYPRLRRSNTVVPYPRIGRSTSVVPYPRLGRSNSVVPYPRLGRSKRSLSVVSYPRLGRSDTIVPYLRLGRSESVVPYPRPGRSESVVPYPRPGRAESLVPYPRPGRSESVVPYPRPGRAELLVPYPRPGRSESVVPYPRPGRAESLVPYPRPGRSESVVPYPRLGRGESIVPYPRPGRSDSVVPYPRLGRSSMEKTVLTNKYGKVEDILLPNLRPGRSNVKKDIKSKTEYIALDTRSEMSEDEENYESSDTISNSLSEANLFKRYDRATHDQGYVLPHPRIGRAILNERKERESIDSDTVIPYPRLGRSEKEIVPSKTSPNVENSVHKLNKHMLTSVEDSVYLLPYPRPGRYSE